MASAASGTEEHTPRPLGRVERRRARVRQQLLEAAEALMGERGVDAVTVEEITEAADIARRTFYHHFGSKHDLLVPIARARTKSLNRRIDRLIEEVQDPAEAVSIALRHTFRGIPEDPLCAWFVLRSGLPYERLLDGIGESGTRDVARGVAAGRFAVDNHAAGSTLFVGSLIAVISARVDGRLRDEDLDDAVEYALRLLGVPAVEASEIAHRPLPSLPEEPGDSEE
ncbi:MAG: TetR/AcrR family transcriptional regulator [Deltaproteobacteria bacterium]|nr:TetR/AcrR family transcriptional regulator [Deltaproteobacteria bacterium]